MPVCIKLIPASEYFRIILDSGSKLHSMQTPYHLIVFEAKILDLNVLDAKIYDMIKFLTKFF